MELDILNKVLTGISSGNILNIKRIGTESILRQVDSHYSLGFIIPN